jgi:hypothetical protein
MERNIKGRFVKGKHYSPVTEFKKGEHWRSRKPFWDREWLLNEYITLNKPASQIADEQGCKENNILYWLNKHNIPCRDMKEIRKRKYWGLKGEQNGMYNKKGSINPNWKGGFTPERQAFYSSLEWKRCIPAVWKRDNATCRNCKTKDNTKTFAIHHIVSFAVKEKRADIDNLILLCRKCHCWVHSKQNRENRWLK